MSDSTSSDSRSGFFAAGAATALIPAFFSLILGIALTLGIQALTVSETKGGGTPSGITEARIIEIVRTHKDASVIGVQTQVDDLRAEVEALRKSLREWQVWAEGSRCRCRHPGVPGSPGVGAVGSAVMESAPPKVGDK